MPLLKSCCCWKSVRSGSIASGIYTTLLYLVLSIVATYHVTETYNPPVMLAICIIAISLSGLCVLSSICLFFALWKSNSLLLLPWLICIATTTSLDVILSFSFVEEAVYDPFIAVLFIMDVFICSLNVYSLLCVFSLFQEYRATDVRIRTESRKETKRDRTPSPPGITEIPLLSESSRKTSLMSAKSNPYTELTVISEERSQQEKTDDYIQLLQISPSEKSMKGNSQATALSPRDCTRDELRHLLM